MKLTSNRIKVDIDLENGIHVFSCSSATGKTRLFTILQEYYRKGEPVLTYTYDDYRSGLDFYTISEKRKYQLVMIDRYDMFDSKFSDKLLELSKNSIVLIDSKQQLFFTKSYGRCYINMTPDRIEVVK